MYTVSSPSSLSVRMWMRMAHHLQHRHEGDHHLHAGGMLGKQLPKGQVGVLHELFADKAGSLPDGVGILADPLLLGPLLRVPGPRQGLQEGFQQPLRGGVCEIRLLPGGRQLLGEPGEPEPGLVVEGAQLLSGGLVDLILLQPADEGLLRVLLLVLLQGGGPGQQVPGLQIHQLGRHREEVAGRVQLVLGELLHIGKVFRGDLGHEDILDVHLRLLDQVEQEIEGSVEILDVYPISVHDYATKSLLMRPKTRFWAQEMG